MDRDYYRCPVEGCGEVIEGEAVSDATFIPRLRLHKLRHDPGEVDRQEDATVIAALALYALQAADPSHAIILLERRGCTEAAETIIGSTNCLRCIEGGQGAHAPDCAKAAV